MILLFSFRSSEHRLCFLSSDILKRYRPLAEIRFADQGIDQDRGTCSGSLPGFFKHPIDIFRLVQQKALAAKCFGDQMVIGPPQHRGDIERLRPLAAALDANVPLLGGGLVEGMHDVEDVVHQCPAGARRLTRPDGEGHLGHTQRPSVALEAHERQLVRVAIERLEKESLFM